MKLIAQDGNVICPLCDVRMDITRPKYLVAVNVKHPASECQWSGHEYRVNPNNGDAERIGR